MLNPSWTSQEHFKLTMNEAEELMIECKDEQLNKLKKSKNAYKGALLAEYVTVIPSLLRNSLTCWLKRCNDEC